MQRHLSECEACARHDTAVRRGLLVFRNLPPIEPSAKFAERLAARLEQARREVELQRRLGASSSFAGQRGAPGLGAFAAAAASVVIAGYLVTAGLARVSPPPQLALEPVIATQPEPRVFALTALPGEVPPPSSAHAQVSPAVVAAVSTGMPLWSTVMMSDAGSAGFRVASLRR